MFIPSALFSYLLMMFLVHDLLTFLYIYKNGIEVLETSIIPFKFRREYITYEEIEEVEIIKGDNLITLYIHVEEREAYELDKFDISNLEEAKNLILSMKDQTFS